MASLSDIPGDVQEWIRRVFKECNAAATLKLANNPNIQEELNPKLMQPAGSPQATAGRFGFTRSVPKVSAVRISSSATCRHFAS
jgi:hypothetical protein